MRLKNTKKALGFFALIVPVAIILMSLTFILKIGPTNSLSGDLGFTSIYKKVDLVSFEDNANKLFLNSLIDLEFKKVKSTLVDNSYISSSDLLDNTQNDYTKEDFLSCRINLDKENLNIWYNEKNLKYYKDNHLFSDNKNQKLNLKNALTKDEILCINNYKDNFGDLISSNYKDDIESILSSLGFNYNIDVNYDTKLNSLNVNLVSTLTKNSKNNLAKVTDKININKNYNFGQYPNLILSIQNSLPQLASASKAEVPICMKNKDNSNEVDCMLKTLKSLIKKQENGDKVLSDYDFQIEQIPNFKDQKYLALKINVLSKKTKSKVLDFGVVVEDNIPFSLVNFNLVDVPKVDNVIEVQIEKPKFDLSKIDKFVIMYSYENFFDNSNSNYPYNKLINELKNREIPFNPIQDNYYITDKDLDLDMLSVKPNNNGFEKVSITQKYYNKNIAKIKDTSESTNDKYYLKVDIYQKYNYKIKKFELLKTQNLYVYVFALDKNNNYYVANIQGKSKLVSPKLKIGPIPLTTKQITVNGNLKDAKLQNSLSIKTSNYNQSTFDHYDIYITPINKGQKTKNDGNSKKLVYGCQNVDFECNYFNGDGILTNKNLNLLITADQNYIINYQSKTDKEKAKLPFPIFSGNLDSKNIPSGKFILENGKTYEVYVIPVDSFKNSILSRITPAFNLKPTGSSNNYYTIDSTSGLLGSDIVATLVLIQDNQPPKENDISDGKISNGESLVFNFNIKDNADISKIEGIIKFYDQDNSWIGNSDSVYVDLKDNNKIKYSSSGEVVKFDTSKYSKVDFTSLKLFDSNDNFVQTTLNYEFSG